MAHNGMTVEKKSTKAGDFLIITIPVNNPLKPSFSGKTLLVASSNGNQQTELLEGGKPIYVGLNAYVKK